MLGLRCEGDILGRDTLVPEPFSILSWQTLESLSAYLSTAHDPLPGLGNPGRAIPPLPQ